VLNVDADEFYWPEAGPDLRTIFAAVPERWGAIKLPVCDFLAPAVSRGCFADAMTVREVRSLKPGGRAQVLKVAHRGRAEIKVSRGAHGITAADLEHVPAWQPIIGLHFPMRSYEQFERKVTKSGRAAAIREPERVDSRNFLRLRMWEGGRLHELYDEHVATPEKVEAGLSDGRLVVDERLKGFFASGAAPHSARPIDPRAVEDARRHLMRTLHEWQGSPMKRDIERERARVSRLERRVERVQHRLDRVQHRLAYLESLPELWPRRVASRLVAGWRRRR
jgi:hypothetical protein